MSTAFSLIAVAIGASSPAMAGLAVSEPLTAGGMLSEASRLLDAGRTEDALSLLRAVTGDRDSDTRLEAHFRLAKLDAALGRRRDAASRLRLILDERPDATPVRLELAGLLAAMGDYAAARRELRLGQAANLPPWIADDVDNFRDALMGNRPFGGAMRIGFVNDSNVNRATRADTLGTVLGEFVIDEGSKQTAGKGLSADVNAFYRIPIGNGHQFRVKGTAVARFQ